MSEKPKRSRGFLLLALGVAVTVGAVFGWRIFQARNGAIDSIPPRPDLRGRPAALVDRISEGERATRTWLHPETGLVALSRLYHANGFYNEALRCYAGLQRIDSRDGRWPHLQASILAEFGQLDAALPLEERAVTLAPDYLPARLRLGDIFQKADKPAAAVKAYSDVLTRDAGNPYALLGLAKCDLAAGDWNRARDRLRDAAVRHPDFIGALSLLVTVAEHFGDQTEAAALRARIGKREFVDVTDPWLDELLEDCFDPYRLSVAASLAKFSGDVAASRRRLERAVELAPNEAAYRRQLGKLLSQQRDYAAARPQIEKAVALEPSDSDAWILLIDVFTAAGDTVGAQRALSAGLVACPQSAALHYTNGQRLSRMSGNEAPAIAEFKTAKELRPSEANAYIDLALLYFQLERVNDAVVELKAALKVQPGHPLAMEVLTRHAINTGDEAGARQWIAQLRTQPRVPAEDLRVIIAEFQQHFGRAP